jgi:cardiolipin synthase
MQRKEQIMNHPKRQRRRPSLMRTMLRMTGMLVALQAMIVIVLQVVSAQRQRPEGSFPHPHLDEVSVGANCLQIYDYGRDLYDAMLAAIDAAGQEFKEHLARKAAEGHGKMTKKLVFQA